MDAIKVLTLDLRFFILLFIILNLNFPITISKMKNILEFSYYTYRFVSAKRLNAISPVSKVGRSFAVNIPSGNLNVGFSQFIQSKPKRSAGTFGVTRPLPTWLGKRRPARCDQTAAEAAEPAGAKRRSI